MSDSETVATLTVGAEEERILLRLSKTALSAEVAPEHWARIQEKALGQFAGGTLVDDLLAAGTPHLLQAMKRWYLGPHDLAAVDVSYDGCLLRVQRHGMGDVLHPERKALPNTFYMALDTVGGSWSEGFEPAEAQAFVEKFGKLREARLQTLGYLAGVGARALAGAAAAGALAFAIAWTIRNPRKPGKG